MTHLDLNHEKFMLLALKQAEIAFNNDEVPVGAVLVSPSGQIFSMSSNSMELSGQQCSHAEFLAIKEACSRLGTWRLDGFSLYVTLEPCLMCFGLISLSRISVLVYGAGSPLFGYTNYLQGDSGPYGKNILIKSGLKAEKSAAILKMFFERTRA